MKLGDQVIYFYDGGAYIRTAIILTRPTANGIAIGVFPKDASQSLEIRDGAVGGFVTQAANLQECFNPGDRFITLGQAADWGINLTDGTQNIADLL